MRRNLPKLEEQVGILNEKYVEEEKYVVEREDDEDMNDEVTQDSERLGFAKEAMSLVEMVKGAWLSANKVFVKHPHHEFPDNFGEVLRGCNRKFMHDRKTKAMGADSLQKVLSRAVDHSRARMALDKLKSEGKKEEIARIISQKDSGASSAFLVMPSSPDLVLPPKAAKIAEKLGAGLIKLSGLPCPCGHGKMSLDHVLGCGKMRMVTIRHDLISSILLKAMTKAGLVARWEWLVEGDSSKRMDILLFNGGKQWQDISVVNPQAPSYVKAAQKAEGAIKLREASKTLKWSADAEKREASFTPIVLESTGRRSENTKILLTQIAESAAAITEEDVSTNSKKEHFINKVINEITQHLSVSMAHSNALIIEEAESLAAFKTRPSKLSKRASLYGNPSFKLF
jgi:hypothetical protein